LLRQESFVDGKYRDVLTMAILRQDYERTRGA
jgi:RimJ/RimL family protein N-acetyltransferase